MTDRVLYFLKNIPNNIAGWEEKFPNLTQQQSYIDKDFSILGAEAVNFFKSKGLTPIFGIIWSWPYRQNQELFYHTDQWIDEKGGITSGDVVSMNFLLAGDSGRTEFVSFEKTTEMNSSFYSKKVKFNYRKFDGSSDPDNTYILTKDKPSIMRIDVPHRVNTNDIQPDQCRWSYSLRFNVGKNAADWETCIDRLSDHLIP
jgi:hypothetical protein